MRRILLTLLLATYFQAQTGEVRTAGTDSNLRGLSVTWSSNKHPVQVGWASGSKGVVLRSEDHGDHWERLNVDGGEILDFRGIQAINEKIAYLMSSGSGGNSRIYKTSDGGSSWKQQYTDKRQAFFLDAIQCMDAKHCFALSDPIDGKFLLLVTNDGEHWEELPRNNMPDALTGEGAFAASNGSLTIYDNKEIYFGTGGGAAARVFHSPDRGRTWTTTEVPIAAGNASSGVFSVIRFGNTVIVVGGDYKDPNQGHRTAAYSNDGGSTWNISSAPPAGFRSSVAGPLNGKQFLAVGPSGIDVSRDEGITWTRWEMDSLNFNAVTVSVFRYVWIVGAKGEFLYRGEIALRH